MSLVEVGASLTACNELAHEIKDQREPPICSGHAGDPGERQRPETDAAAATEFSHSDFCSIQAPTDWMRGHRPREGRLLHSPHPKPSQMLPVTLGTSGYPMTPSRGHMKWPPPLPVPPGLLPQRVDQGPEPGKAGVTSPAGSFSLKRWGGRYVYTAPREGRSTQQGDQRACSQRHTQHPRPPTRFCE